MTITDPREHRLADELVDEARASIAAGDAAAAPALCYRAIVLHPQVGDIYLRVIADAHARLGDEESAKLCRRGMVPEADATRHLDGPLHARRARRDDAPSGDVRNHPVYPAERVALPPPSERARPDELPALRHASTDASAKSVTEIDGGEVWFDGINTLVMDREGRTVTSQTRGSVALGSAAARPREPVRLDGTACFLGARSGPLYYHWMVDVLPKLHLLEKAGFAPGTIDHVVVNVESAFAARTLAHWGVPPERIVSLGRVSHVRAERLLMAPLRSDIGSPLPYGLGLGLASWIPAALRERFVDPVAGAAERGGERLYVSRAKAGVRGVAEEEALAAALAERGFRRVFLEDHDIVEQAALMDGASIVLAPHGGGLTNIAFCRPGTLVLEIFGDYVVPCFWSLAAISGLRYARYARMDAPGAEPMRPGSDRTVGISIDTGHFIGWLDGRLEAEPSGAAASPERRAG